MFGKKNLIRTKETCGADELTPSRAEYFTWVNNTNEGSNEAQTLANLAFFGYLKEKYGMQLDIYAWDAGNLDGAKKTYADFSKGKLKAQYPNGYAPIVEAAKKLGIRMGVWGGADGYGDTPEEEAARRELLVSLCRDYNFELFKFDRVCGKLRKEKRPAFAKTMQACRKYSPDLVLLLHRNKVGKEYIYATTDLWQWVETYVDANSWNSCTAPHHRAFAFTRGLTPNLSRLYEDHGVCISSYCDYFEDDMIIQAFGRSLVLAPEIYGNPFFLRDDEYAIMARIFNLHRQYRDILVNGIRLPKSYGKLAVSRGDGERRFICTSNPSWKATTITLTIGEELGLKKGEKFTVIKRFPTESVIGEFAFGEKVDIKLMPFRALLVEVVASHKATTALQGCEYLTLHEKNGEPDLVKVIKSSGEIHKTSGATRKLIKETEVFDNTERAPEFLGSMKKTNVPKNDRKLYEAAMYAVNNDSFEAQTMLRSGATNIPEVQKARDLFFNQDSYVYRGLESKALFDGNLNTYFGTRSAHPIQTQTICGGTLRVDIGEQLYADSVEIDFFEADENVNNQTPPQTFGSIAEYSTDLSIWTKAKVSKLEIVDSDATQKLVVHNVNNIVDVHGVTKRIIIPINDRIRYFQLPKKLYRIISFNLIRDGRKVPVPLAKANNQMAPYSRKKTKTAYKTTISIPSNADNSFIAIAVNGLHWLEGVYCAATIGDKAFGMDERAPSFTINTWQHEAMPSPINNTFYLNITEDMKGKTMDLYALINIWPTFIKSIDVYLCPKHIELTGINLEL